MGKKKKIKRKIKTLIFIIIIAGIIFVGYKYYPHNKISKYSDEAIKYIKDNKISIKNNKYSETLDKVLKSKKYVSEYLDEYQNIKYLKTDNFIDKINNYLKKGYNAKEINNIFKLSNKNQDKLLNNDNKIDFEKYKSIKNLDVDRIERYNDYYKEHNEDLKNIVTYVNINLDKKFYTDTKEVKDPNDLLVLVNKYNHLPDNYKPNDLVYVSGAYGNEVPFREVLKDSFIELQNKAKEDININLMPTTAFRNHSFQTTLYNNYVAKDGVEAADTYSARPGYSEHQTGLAIDLKNTSLSDTRLTDDNFKWLNDNAYKYGFIIRFPEGKKKITGYQFENWHIRYVGKEHAKIIHDNNLTLEEYIDLYITEY